MTTVPPLLRPPSREEKRGSERKLKVMLSDSIPFMRKIKSTPEAAVSSGYHQLNLGQGE